MFGKEDSMLTDEFKKELIKKVHLLMPTPDGKDIFQ